MDACTSWYGKMSEAEEIEYRRKTRERLTIIGVSTFLLLITIGTIVGVTFNIAGTVVRVTVDKDSAHFSVRSATTVSAISAVCSTTRFPNSCYSSISSAKTASSSDDPKDIFKLSLKVAIEALLNVTSVPDALSSLTDDKVVQSALSQCKELFNDAIDRLNESVQLMSTVPGKKSLTQSQINTLRSLISAAVTDQVTCMDGLEDTTGNIQEKMGAAMVNSTQFTSNSLAIATNVISHPADFNFPSHRKLLATSNQLHIEEYHS